MQYVLYTVYIAVYVKNKLYDVMNHPPGENNAIESLQSFVSQRSSW